MEIIANVGFIGTGGIASALVRGLCGSPDFKGKIFVSVHKNRAAAEKLRADFPDMVCISESNQEIIDSAEILFPTLLPKVLPQVFSSLKMRESSRIIHVAAGIKTEEAARIFAPAEIIVRAVPLPFAENRMGPIVSYGGDELCNGLLSLLGAQVKAESEKELEILASVTGIMVSYYGLTAQVVDWCVYKGMSFENALEYTCRMNTALSEYMRSNCRRGEVEDFLKANTTPHGMNELAFKILNDSDAYKAWRAALEKVGEHYNL